jgi:hypothetical protein
VEFVKVLAPSRTFTDEQKQLYTTLENDLRLKKLVVDHPYRG